MTKAILVADDDPDILSIVSMSLETQGYTVHKATNGREAVDLAKTHHPDLILMDMMMPTLDGMGAIARIREIEAQSGVGHKTPIIAVTAHAMRGDMERFLEGGADGYVAKPIRFDELKREITRVIMETPGG